MILESYAGIAPKRDLIIIRLLGRRFAGRTFLHVNSTRVGGGVAEILHRMLPILNDIGIRARWEVIEGDPDFFDMTKKIHNALQGKPEEITSSMWEHHFQVNRINAEGMDLGADFAFIHDPQPVPLIDFRPSGAKWVWRCHIDLSTPHEAAAERIQAYALKYEAAIFSVAKFARGMPVPEYVVLPSIDPLSEKNRELEKEEIEEIANKFNIPPGKPLILQVSRFDRFKDPLGVIKAWRMVRKYNDCMLVLAGSPATDDPEGPKILAEVEEFAAGDPDIKVLLLPAFSDREINALQRLATVVLQKSVKEGFGLTVSEAMWKGKPVIGGAVGGIPYQIIHGQNGFLVHSVEGAAFRIRQFLNSPDLLKSMGEKAREHVRNNFLITRQIRDYLSVWAAVEEPESTSIMMV